MGPFSMARLVGWGVTFMVQTTYSVALSVCLLHPFWHCLGLGTCSIYAIVVIYTTFVYCDKERRLDFVAWVREELEADEVGVIYCGSPREDFKPIRIIIVCMDGWASHVMAWNHCSIIPRHPAYKNICCHHAETDSCHSHN